jgi:hypothetical protein
MTPAQLANFTKNASPSYAYVLPHRNQHKYCYVKNDNHPLSPVFSDASSDDGSGSFTPNHEGRLAQIQFADGSSKWFRSWKLVGVDDDMSHNDLGQMHAGRRPLDIVLGNSGAVPGEETAE